MGQESAKGKSLELGGTSAPQGDTRQRWIDQVYKPPVTGDSHVLPSSGDNKFSTLQNLYDALNAEGGKRVGQDKKGPSHKEGQKESPEDEEKRFNKAIGDLLKTPTNTSVNLNPYGGMSYLEALAKVGLPKPTDPGMSGGIGQMERDVRQHALLEKYILDGMGYQEARQKAGLPRDIDPGFSGGSGAIVENTIKNARLEQYILKGIPYQEARQRAGLPRDVDPGYSGGIGSITEHIRQQAMLKRYMLYGEDRSKWQH